ncbi:transcription factor TAFII-31, partial [Pseudovirgaria hyperparasitica]
RPRDQRILHLVLASMGVHAYEERVPLMLQDFAYRYQVGILADALALSPDNHLTAAHEPGSKKAAQQPAEPVVKAAAIRQAIGSRVAHQFCAGLPKEFLLELGMERNRTVLPRVEREFGVRLPAEKFCLTGTGWGL